MRLIGHRDERGRAAVGVVRGDAVLTVDALVEAGLLPPERRGRDLGGLLEDDPGLVGLSTAVAAASAGVGRPVPSLHLSTLRPAAAVARPGKIVCIGLNYREHIAEQKAEIPDRPLLFAKFANTVAADGEPVVRPAGTTKLDLEAELGVVIGRTARRVRAADGWEHVAGYVALNDISARDWQGNKVALEPGERGDGQWLRAKGSDTFLPMSPTFVTLDEIGRDRSLAVRSWLTRATGPDAGRPIPMQDGRTADLLFDIPALIEHVSAVITLEPGDVISTGTPSGVGVFRDPPVYLLPGDVARVEVEGVGAVESPVVDADATAPAGSPAARLIAARRG